MTDNEKKYKIIRIAVSALLLAGAVFAVIYFMPFFLSLADSENRAIFIEKLRSLGAGGFFAMLGVQVFQIIVAVLPGEPIETMAGVMFGPFGGLAVCMLGIVIGSVTVYFLVKLLGKDLVNKIFSSESINKFSFLKDSKKTEIIMFILFFIPGTPKDILTYLAPLTRVKPHRYFIISALARIPSVITSTFAGEWLGNGNLKATIIMFAVTGMLGIAGLVFNDKIIALLSEKKSEK